MNTNTLTLESIRSTKQDGPCVSIYFHKPSVRMPDQLPSIQLYRQLRYARELLEGSMSRQAADEYLKPLFLVAKDELLRDEAAPIALFKSGEVSTCVRLGEEAPPQTVVADDFHVKPFIKRESPQAPESLRWALTLCRKAMTEGRALTSLFQVAQALRSGKVQCLWVAEDETLWGMLNRDRGTVVLHPRQMNHRDGDVLDDLAEWATDLGIDVHVLPRHQIPGQHCIIAEV